MNNEAEVVATVVVAPLRVLVVTFKPKAGISVGLEAPNCGVIGFDAATVVVANEKPDCWALVVPNAKGVELLTIDCAVATVVLVVAPKSKVCELVVTGAVPNTDAAMDCCGNDVATVAVVVAPKENAAGFVI